MPKARMDLKLTWQPGWPALLAKCETGHLVLFCGAAWSSMATELYTASHDSHVALLFRVDHLTPKRARPFPADGLLLWETIRGGCACYDYISNSVRTTGCRLVSLSERIANSYDQIECRILPLVLDNCERPGKVRADLNQTLWPLFTDLQSVPFDNDPLVLFKAAYDGPFGENPRFSETMFCSDGIARLLIKCGLVASDCNTREVTPSDFERNQLPLVKCHFDEPRLLARSESPPLVWRICECTLV